VGYLIFLYFQETYDQKKILPAGKMPAAGDDSININ